MNQNDYIIAFDENGSPYIAHASWAGIKNAASNVASRARSALKGVQRAGHKYYARLEENGKYLYFYSKEELDAHNRKAQDANRWAKMAERVNKENAAKAKADPTKENKRRAMLSGQGYAADAARANVAKREAQEAQKRYSNSLNGRAESAFNNAKASANNTVTNAKNNLDRMKNEFSNKADSVVSKARSYLDKVLNVGNDAVEKAQTAIQNGSKSASDYLTAGRDSIRQAFNSNRDSVRSMISNAISATNEKVQQAQGAVRNGSKKAADYLTAGRDAIADKLGVDEREALMNARNNLNTAERSEERALNSLIASRQLNANSDTLRKNQAELLRSRDDTQEAREALGKAQSDYNRTAIGRAENAVGEVQSMINQARSAVSGAGKAASNKVQNSIDKADQAVKDVRSKASDLADMSMDQLKQMNRQLQSSVDSAKSAVKDAGETAREYINTGRETIKNTTGIGLRNTPSAIQAKIDEINEVHDEVARQRAAALRDGDYERGRELNRTLTYLNENKAMYERQKEGAQFNYDRSLGGQAENAARSAASAAKTITASQANNLREKYESGKKLTQDEMNKLLTYFFRNSAD